MGFLEALRADEASDTHATQLRGLAGLIRSICLPVLTTARVRVIDDGLEISPTFNDRSSSRHEAIEDRGLVRSPRQKCPAGRDTRLRESRNLSSLDSAYQMRCACTRTTDTASTARCTFSLEEILSLAAHRRHQPGPIRGHGRLLGRPHKRKGLQTETKRWQGSRFTLQLTDAMTS